MLCKAIRDIELSIGVGLDKKNVQEIFAVEFKAGKRIFIGATGEPIV